MNASSESLREVETKLVILKVVNGSSKQTDGLTTVASTEGGQDAKDARKDKDFIGKDVSQYSSVISGDMNLDILPLEQDISDTDGLRDPSFMKVWIRFLINREDRSQMLTNDVLCFISFPSWVQFIIFPISRQNILGFVDSACFCNLTIG